MTCSPCNLRKGHKLAAQAGMKLLHWPVEPSNFQLQENGRAFPPNFLHQSWSDFLYWDAELDQF